MQSEESFQTDEMKAEQTDKITEIQSEITSNQDELQSYEVQLQEKRARIELIKETDDAIRIGGANYAVVCREKGKRFFY